MIAVSNTSPISNLAYIGRLDLLRTQFSDFRIPPAVAQELNAHPNPVALAAINAALRQWIRIVAPQDTPFHRMLLRQIHAGEAEAIVLATELGASIIVIDEQERRALARQAELSVTGTPRSPLTGKTQRGYSGSHTGDKGVARPRKILLIRIA
jgi:hypothetical protein